jgi:RNA polymerase sigma-70 factor (sigma-E family)
MADADEFSGFVRDSSRGLQRTAWLLTGDWTAAEDLAQAALVKTWARWDRVELATAMGYTRRVMFSVFLGWRGRRSSHELPVGSLPDAPADRDEYEQIELRTALLDALARLPRQQRAVVVLRYFDDLTEAATADALGCSVGTVKSHASRALNALRAAPGLAPLVDEGALP